MRCKQKALLQMYVQDVWTPNIPELKRAVMHRARHGREMEHETPSNDLC